MGRKKGSKNKPESSVEVYFAGYFLMEGGLKVEFDIPEEDGGDEFRSMLDCKFVFEDDRMIWLGDFSIRAKKVLGFYIYDYES